MKLRLFLLESGQLDRVTVVEGKDEAEQKQLADRLATRLEKVTFPTAEIAPGEYRSDSDALVTHFASVAAVEPEKLPTYQAYVGHVLPRLQQLFEENTELKQRAA